MNTTNVIHISVGFVFALSHFYKIKMTANTKIWMKLSRNHKHVWWTAAKRDLSKQNHVAHNPESYSCIQCLKNDVRDRMRSLLSRCFNAAILCIWMSTCIWDSVEVIKHTKPNDAMCVVFIWRKKKTHLRHTYHHSLSFVTVVRLSAH